MFDKHIHEAYNSADGNIQTEHFYVYSADGQLARQFAQIGGAITESRSFEYDSLGRLIRSREENESGVVQRTQHLYDYASRLTEQDWVVGTTAYSENYTYNSSDSSLSTFKVTANPDDSSIRSYDSLSFSYDGLKRIQQVTDTETTPEHSGLQRYTRNYTYQPHPTDADRTTNRIAAYKVKDSGNEIIVGNAYTYDASGNITKIDEVFTVSGTEHSRTVAEYTYDALDQLQTETRYSYSGNSTTPSGTTAVNYTIDTAGNVREISGARTFSFSYGDEDWADKLTAVNYDGLSETINYTSGGNPSNWYNGSIYSNLTWTQGRRLSSVQRGTATSSYTYDMDGVRMSKIADGKKHEYVTQNGKVVRETVTNSSGGAFLYALDFTYDESGNPLTMRRYFNADLSSYYTLHYICNLQGDVMKLLGDNNVVYASYTYDAWGNILSAVEKPGFTYAAMNPLRYRGYYYDSETGWYYLQSRYYDPALGRFINADSYASTGQGFPGYNMFAYCNNNPVNKTDTAGGVPKDWILEGGCVGYTDSRTGTVKAVGEQSENSESVPTCSNAIHSHSQSVKEETGATFLLGLTARAAFGMAANASFYTAIDTHGNIATYYSFGGGGGFPAASAAVFGGAVSSPNAGYLEGLGFATGGSGGEGAGIGGDYVIIVDKEHNATYHGGTGSVGVLASVPVPVEVHGDVSYSYKLFQFNIVDIFSDAVQEIKKLLGLE